jgi:hypothetical protein
MPELTLFVSSDQGQSRSADGSSFTFPLSPALQIPYEKDNEVILSVTEANLWYTSPNVSVARKNTKLRFAIVTKGLVSNNTAILEEHTITFAEGLYSLSDIRSEINAYCAGKNIPDTLLDVVGHTPTQSVEVLWDVQASGHGCVIYMGDADSIGALLGYSENLIYDTHAFDTPVEIATFRAPEAAHFDAVSLFLIHISCINGSNYSADGTISQVACAITPDQPPGSLLRHRPLYPIRCDASSLTGARTSSLRFSITDGNGNACVLKEAWNARVVISY